MGHNPLIFQTWRWLPLEYQALFIVPPLPRIVFWEVSSRHALDESRINPSRQWRTDIPAIRQKFLVTRALVSVPCRNLPISDITLLIYPRCCGHEEWMQRWTIVKAMLLSDDPPWDLRLQRSIQIQIICRLLVLQVSQPFFTIYILHYVFWSIFGQIEQTVCFQMVHRRSRPSPSSTLP